MREEEIPYNVLESQILDELAKLGTPGLYERGILATCVDNYVTARRLVLLQTVFQSTAGHIGQGNMNKF